MPFVFGLPLLGSVPVDDFVQCLGAAAHLEPLSPALRGFLLASLYDLLLLFYGFVNTRQKDSVISQTVSIDTLMVPGGLQLLAIFLAESGQLVEPLALLLQHALGIGERLGGTARVVIHKPLHGFHAFRTNHKNTLP